MASVESRLNFLSGSVGTTTGLIPVVIIDFIQGSSSYYGLCFSMSSEQMSPCLCSCSH